MSHVLSTGETANGEYPTTAVGYMSRTCIEAESMVDYNALFESTRHQVISAQGRMSPVEVCMHALHRLLHLHLSIHRHLRISLSNENTR